MSTIHLSDRFTTLPDDQTLAATVQASSILVTRSTMKALVRVVVCPCTPVACVRGHYGSGH